MVAFTADRKLLAYRMDNSPTEWQSFDSQLKQQLRCISIFKHKNGNEPFGFAYGSIEGRVAIHNFKPEKTNDNFTFKCHRYVFWTSINCVRINTKFSQKLKIWSKNVNLVKKMKIWPKIENLVKKMKIWPKIENLDKN